MEDMIEQEKLAEVLNEFLKTNYFWIEPLTMKTFGIKSNEVKLIKYLANKTVNPWNKLGYKSQMKAIENWRDFCWRGEDFILYERMLRDYICMYIKDNYKLPNEVSVKEIIDFMKIDSAEEGKEIIERIKNEDGRLDYDWINEDKIYVREVKD